MRFFVRLLFALLLAPLFVLSPPPPARAQSAELNKRYQQYQALNKAGKYRQALVHAKKVLSLGEKEFGPRHRNVGIFLNNLAGLYEKQGNYSKAESLYMRSVTISEKMLGSNHPSVAADLTFLAVLYSRQGRFGEAAAIYERTVAIYKMGLPPNHPSIATSLNDLAEVYKKQGRSSEAEPLLRRSLRLREQALGLDHPHVATSLNNLAELFYSQGRYNQAEPLYKRSLGIFEERFDKDHPFVATSLNNLAANYSAQGRYNDAEPLQKRSLRIREVTLGKNHPFVATSLNNLATNYSAQGRYSDAAPLLRRAIAIEEKILGSNHHEVGASLINLAMLYTDLRRYEEAESLYKRSLKISKKALGTEHITVSITLNNLAALYYKQSDWRRAAENWRRATGVLTRRASRGGIFGRGVRGKKKSEVALNYWYFKNLVKSVFREGSTSEATHEMFETAQWAIQSQAAGALAQMSSRQSASSRELADMVRERQDKVGTWQKSEKRMNALRGAGKSDKKLQTLMAALDKRIAKIDKRLTKDFPDYAALTSPKPLSIKQAQKLLKPNEALILLLDMPKGSTPAETFIWAVTKDKAVWKRAELGGKALSDKIAQLRKELDPATATRSAPPSNSARVGQRKNKRGFAPLKEIAGFSLETAHELYAKLLGPVEDVIRDKSHLMVVGSGPLTALPFQVLVKTKPQFSGEQKYQKADWLVRHHAITTLPSVASLQALRGIAKTATRAPDALIGFADPVFSRSKTPIRMASTDKTKRGYASFFRGGKVNLASLAALASLPGTRRELQGIGRILGIKKRHLLFGRDASEAAVKKAALNRYRIVYFATHGLVSGDVQGLGEPALAFSLPAKASSLDDGLLTASEVTQLKLNADWVVMSACNTASGDKPGAQALSGLARAFFYAGAKTLLVSHWPVGDEAAVALTTHAFKSMQTNPKLGKSQALRQSMLLMIKQGGDNAHPTNWAPFVVVGEGGSP